MTTTAKRPDQLISILRSDFPLGLVPIAQTTLAAPAASVTFAGIPQNFRSLVFVIQARTDRANTVDNFYWQANADAGANYDLVQLYGNNSVAGSFPSIGGAAAAVLGLCDAANSRASCFGGCFAIFPDYRNAVIEKQSWSFGGNVGTPTAATMWAFLHNCHWRSAAAITSLAFYPSIGPNFVAGSVFQLYGVL